MTQTLDETKVCCPVLTLVLNEARIATDETADKVRDKLLDMAEEIDARYIALDMSQVDFLSSAGLRPFIAVNKQLTGRGGRLFVCNVQPMVREVLELTRLVTGKGASPVQFYAADDIPSAVKRIYEEDDSL